MRKQESDIIVWLGFAEGSREEVISSNGAEVTVMPTPVAPVHVPAKRVIPVPLHQTRRGTPLHLSFETAGQSNAAAVIVASGESPRREDSPGERGGIPWFRLSVEPQLWVWAGGSQPEEEVHCSGQR